MTDDQLTQLLNGQNLLQALDVKTLVLDLVRQMSQEELLHIFNTKLPQLDADTLRGYFFMQRL
jgi:hypothetical protein